MAFGLLTLNYNKIPFTVSTSRVWPRKLTHRSGVISYSHDLLHEISLEHDRYFNRNKPEGQTEGGRFIYLVLELIGINH
jgi:hypothetical protein